MQHSAKSNWSGNLSEGQVSFTKQNGAVDQAKYCFNKPTETGEGVHFEDVIPAVYATCFNIAVSSILAQMALYPTSLDTEATLCMEGTYITRIHLSIVGTVSGINAREFAAIAKEAENNNLFSKILMIPISSEAHFAA